MGKEMIEGVDSCRRPGARLNIALVRWIRRGLGGNQFFELLLLQPITFPVIPISIYKHPPGPPCPSYQYQILRQLLLWLLSSEFVEYNSLE